MKVRRGKLVVLLIAFVVMPLLSSCARYAHNVNTLYEPSAAVTGGKGEVYIIIPENRQTQSSNVKWPLGNVIEGDNSKIDEVVSARSPAEIIRDAFNVEFKNGGYTVVAINKRHGGEQRIIDLTKAEIDLEQNSGLTNIKAKCRISVGVDVFKDGQLMKRLQYESSSSRVDIKDRDLLANKVLEDALQSVMLKAVPDIHSLFIKNK